MQVMRLKSNPEAHSVRPRRSQLGIRETVGPGWRANRRLSEVKELRRRGGWNFFLSRVIRIKRSTLLASAGVFGCRESFPVQTGTLACGLNNQVEHDGTGAVVAEFGHR